MKSNKSGIYIFSIKEKSQFLLRVAIEKRAQKTNLQVGLLLN